METGGNKENRKKKRRKDAYGKQGRIGGEVTEGIRDVGGRERTIKKSATVSREGEKTDIA